MSRFIGSLKVLCKVLLPGGSEMDCSKRCANFEPRNESPFPHGLRTEDLKIGMVVRRGDHHAWLTYIVLEPPEERWVKVLAAREGYKPTKTWLSLQDSGCQPYINGDWNRLNWLRQVCIYIPKGKPC